MALNGAAIAAMNDAVWLDANRYYEAERIVQDVRRPNPGHHVSESSAGLTHSSIAREIAFARQKIQNFLKSAEAGITDNSMSIADRLQKVERDIAQCKIDLADFSAGIDRMSEKLERLEQYLKENPTNPFTQPETSSKVLSTKSDTKSGVQNGSSATADGDEDLDLFGSDDEEDEAVEKLKEERLKAYANKKAKKPALVAKSSVVLDVKPWDDETDMKEMEKAVRAVQTDGLLWGASKLVPLAYGISKLQIIAIVEDEKVSIDWLQETICEIDDLVQSVDIAAFNKL